VFIVTWNLDLLAAGADGTNLTQVRSLNPPGGTRLVEIDSGEVARLEGAQPIPGEVGVAITSGALAGFRYAKATVGGCFHLFNGKFACAAPNLFPITWDREHAGPWETFKLISREAAEADEKISRDGEGALKLRVQSLLDQGKPLRLHFGCGNTLIPGFLNLDNYAHFGPFGQTEDLFMFDFTQNPWPIPDSSVDYIYSEDFIEHVPQRSQVGFLAEAFRVLKPGCYNRVSTPCLAESMKANSDFSKGFTGVYFGEFDRWAHVALFTKGLFTDLAQAIGYTKVIFNDKGRGLSPYAVQDRRPGEDRTWKNANIFADLMK